MKNLIKLLFVTSLVALSTQAISQAPEGINYQATVRNSSGNLITNQSVSIVFAIKQASVSGTILYQETHSLTTNSYGGFNAIIGSGTATIGTFSSLSWGANSYYLNVTVNGNDLGTTQLISVPYALYAKNSGSSTPGPQGPAGTNGMNGLNGKTILNGTTNPSSQGSIGDFFFNTSSNALFGPKTSSGWGSGTSLIGSQGVQGIAGPQGPAGTNGTNGSQGPAGINGTNGTNGVNGKTVLNGTTNPSSQGMVGDFYINTSSNSLFGPKTATGWGIGTSLIGPTGANGTQGIQGVVGPQGIQGPQGSTGAVGPQGSAGMNGTNGINGTNGVDGKTVLNGISNPSTQGLNGDFYINTTSNTLFGPKTVSGWGSGTSLVGPTGAQGIQGGAGVNGTDGTNGLDGKTIHSGTTLSTSIGTIGDYFINTATHQIYGPKYSGGWGAPTSLIGPSGSAADDQNIDSVTLNENLLTVYIENGTNSSVDLSNLSLFEIQDSIVRTTGGYDSLNFVFGSPQMDDNGNSDHDSRLFFNKEKGALRAGGTSNSSWDEDSLGYNSIGLGYNVIAKGHHSTAMGVNTNSSGNSSTALGINSKASGYHSTAIGDNTEASGYNSTALGINSKASGDGTYAIGNSAVASGNGAIAIGNSPEAVGYHSTALGHNSKASGDFSTAIGMHTQANGYHSTAMNLQTQANGVSSLVVDQYNDTLIPVQVLVNSTTPLLIVGNGDNSTSLSNALTVYKSGEVEINDAYTLPTTDGSANQVITTDGSGNLSWQNSSGGGSSVFQQNQDDIRSTGGYDTLNFVFGSPQIDDDGNNDHLNRMVFHKETGAFRVGATFGKNWDEDSLGYFSFSAGLSTKATGVSSTALGFASEANENNATAIGYYATANGIYSTSIGYFSNALGESSFATGAFTEASGQSSTASGSFTKANGDYSTAINNFTTANGHSSTVVGIFNDTLVAVQNSIGNTTPLFIVGNGNNPTSLSNALTVYKNGEVEINDAYTLPTNDGTTNQVITTDGSGNLSWQNVAGGGSAIFVQDDSVVRTTGGYDSLNFVFGSPQMDHDPSYPNRMFFNKEKGAFRVGSTSGGSSSVLYPSRDSTTWDLDSIGLYSFATGKNTKASGYSSNALGYRTNATGNTSTAMGYNTNATGHYSTAMGDNTKATGYISTAMGYYTEATGHYSSAIGYSTEARGDNSVAMGRLTTATGNTSTALGRFTTASGNYSTAMGGYTDAFGDYSTAMGYGTYANTDYSTVLGRYNDTLTSGFLTTNDLIFAIGNGTSNSNRLNSMHIYQGSNIAYFRGHVRPMISNVNLGSSVYRWNRIYATNGTIQTSDTTLKTNIAPLTYGLADLMKIKTISYNWKDDERQIKKIGFNAQNLLQIIPEVVQTHSEHTNENTGETTYKENETLGVYYSDMIPVLTKSIQEQQEIIEKQVAENDELKKEMKEIKQLLLELMEAKNNSEK